MRINTRVVIDMETGDVLTCEGYEHDGDVALCGGGGGKSQPSMPEPAEYEPTPEQKLATSETTAKDPAAKAVRDAEARKIRSRRGVLGTVLTDPLGTSGNGLLGG